MEEEFIKYKVLMRYLIQYNTGRMHSGLRMYRLWSGFVIDLTRIPLRIKSDGVIQGIDKG
ncbi:MAG: hypothetical protein RMI63_05215 [Caldimicrobium sp.]|nr:hypothetical protein [Caldimicrobium sp.]